LAGQRGFATAEPKEVIHSGPLVTYQARIKSGHLLEDKHQLQAILKLQDTFDSIQNYTPASQPGLLSTWLGIRKDVDAPKGLYIHGAVGGGKTMIMDLFHDTAPTDKKKRVHFNSFMLDIHRRIHSLKNNFVRNSGDKNSRANHYDPIPPVASNIAEESWLICFDEFQVILPDKINFFLNNQNISKCCLGDRHWRCYDPEEALHRTLFSRSYCGSNE
jgi:protein AFG1